MSVPSLFVWEDINQILSIEDVDKYQDLDDIDKASSSDEDNNGAKIVIIEEIELHKSRIC